GRAHRRRVQVGGLPDLAVRAGERPDRARGGGGGRRGARAGPGTHGGHEGVRRARRGVRGERGHGVGDPAARARAARAVPAGAPGRVRRAAQDDLRQDPPGRAARAGVRPVRPRAGRVPRGGLPGPADPVAVARRPHGRNWRSVAGILGRDGRLGRMSFDVSALPDVSGLTVGILGGTGDQGRGLAYRFARGGLTVRIGSRSAERGARAAAELAAMPGVAPGALSGGENPYACGADLVVIAVPFAGHAGTVAELGEALAGKIVVDCVNPLGFDKSGPYALDVPEGSAAQQAAVLLPASRVVAAF